MNEHESFLPYNLPDISDVEIDAVANVRDAGSLRVDDITGQQQEVRPLLLKHGFHVHAEGAL